MTDSFRIIDEFMQEFWDEDTRLTTVIDIFETYGIGGDDAFEFMERLTEKHEIDMTPYRWYFHHGEEGHNLGSIFFKPPDQCVKRIPVTPEVLSLAIHDKRWPLEYPEHELSKTRWDIRLNQLLVIAGVIGFIAVIWNNYVR